jgi:Fe-S-cluster containining protein
MKYRTIDEAKRVLIPALPVSCIEEVKALAGVVETESSSPVSKLKKIYSLTDKITQIIAPHTVCGKNCSHCCKIDVLVPLVEAKYIHKNLGIPPDSGNSVSSGHADARRSCSFLEGAGTCSIYEHRPFACRTYFAFDNPSFCADFDKEHVTYTSESNGLLNKLYLMIINLNGSHPIRDIRDFFPNGRA